MNYDESSEPVHRNDPRRPPHYRHDSSNESIYEESKEETKGMLSRFYDMGRSFFATPAGDRSNNSSSAQDNKVIDPDFRDERQLIQSARFNN